MPLLVADCPRCTARAMTFDVTAQVFRRQEYNWLNWHEVFSVCRQCHRPTVFLIKMTLRGSQLNHAVSEKFSHDQKFLMSFTDALNPYFDVDRYISLRDLATVEASELLPADIKATFDEGAACFSIACYNAAATMFRLCLDMASRPLLPDPNVTPPNSRQRRDLGLRLAWLFDNGLLPMALKELAQCVREDANDGAHAGTLTKEDVEDLIDFTKAFLERLITEPKKLELAEDRRKARRTS